MAKPRDNSLTELQLGVLEVLSRIDVPPEMKDRLEEFEKVSKQIDQSSSESYQYNRGLQLNTLSEILLKVKNVSTEDKAQLLTFIKQINAQLDEKYNQVSQMRHNMKEALTHVEKIGPRPGKS